nr:bifunctional diguanylate cyclase/phosphodiesterase [Stenotrophomonas sp. SY1]
MTSEHSTPVDSSSRTAVNDRLTMLPRCSRLEQKLREPRKPGQLMAVLVIGVDGFGNINQLHGHVFGDELLKAVAMRIRSGVRAGNLVVRLGGDEFAVLAEIEEFGQAATIAKRLLHEMQQPFVVDSKEIDVTVSIGVAMEAAVDGQSSRLLARATAALTEAKELGRNRYAVFDLTMGSSPSEVELMVGDLRRALRAGEFFLLYQPKLDFSSGLVVGMEALLRWTHPEHGQVSPDHFIPLAEKTGMITDIGRWVLEEACRQMHEWHEDQMVDWHVSINASVFQINSTTFYADVVDTLKRNELDPEDLCIEITESGAMRNVELSLMTLRKLSTDGVRISMDDFGVGHSSLSHLARFPVRELKVDRSFVSRVTESVESEAIVRAIIGLAKALGLEVVAEGVESRDQQALLAEMGCDMIQGFLISQPIPSSDVPVLIAKLHERKRAQYES